MGVDLSQVFGTFCRVLDTFSTEAGKKMSERITTMSGKMKELFQVSIKGMDEMSVQLDDGTNFGETFFLLVTVHRKHIKIKK
jgi:hypothetical protein